MVRVPLAPVMTPKVAGLVRSVSGLSKLGWLKGLFARARSSTFQPSVIAMLLVRVIVWDQWEGPRRQDQRAGSGETLKSATLIQTSRLQKGFSGNFVWGSPRSPSRSFTPPGVFGFPFGMGTPLVSSTVSGSPLW